MQYAALGTAFRPKCSKRFRNSRTNRGALSIQAPKNDSDSGDLPVAPRFLSACRNDADTVIFVIEERCKDPELIVPGADEAKYWKTLKACLGVGCPAAQYPPRRGSVDHLRRCCVSFAVCCWCRDHVNRVQSVQLLEFVLNNGNDEVLCRCRARLPSHLALLKKYEPHPLTHRSVRSRTTNSLTKPQVQDGRRLWPESGSPRTSVLPNAPLTQPESRPACHRVPLVLTRKWAGGLMLGGCFLMSHRSGL